MADEERRLCEDLRPIGEHLRRAGHSVSFAGQSWSANCRYWVYFDTALDVEDLRQRFALPAHVSVRENSDPRSGRERGLVCDVHHDAVMGRYPSKTKRPGGTRPPPDSVS